MSDNAVVCVSFSPTALFVPLQAPPIFAIPSSDRGSNLNWLAIESVALKKTAAP
jgi:hypothetical protein